jgi:ribosomal protein S24E
VRNKSKMKKLQETKIPLLSRKKVIFEIEYPKSSTPSHDSVKKQIASSLKLDESLIQIKSIYPKFGLQKAEVTVNVYDSKEKLQKFEIINKKKPKVKEDAKEKTKK